MGKKNSPPTPATITHLLKFRIDYRRAQNLSCGGSNTAEGFLSQN